MSSSQWWWLCGGARAEPHSQSHHHRREWEGTQTLANRSGPDPIHPIPHHRRAGMLVPNAQIHHHRECPQSPWEREDRGTWNWIINAFPPFLVTISPVFAGCHSSHLRHGAHFTTSEDSQHCSACLQTLFAAQLPNSTL